MSVRRRLVLMSCALLCGVGLLAEPVSAEVAPTDSSLVTLVVTVAPGSSTTAVKDEASAVATMSAEDVVGLHATTLTVAASDVSEVTEALDRAGVAARVEVDATATISQIPNDPSWSSQWGSQSSRLPVAWDTTTGSSATVIAVIDTGVNSSPDVAGRILAGYDFVNNDSDPADDHGHGSSVATVAAARGNDSAGIAGGCWSCSILPVKVLDAAGSGFLSDVAEGIVWASDHGADVINLSLGGTTNLSLLDQAVDYAVVHGVVVLGAAGNNGSSNPSYPGASVNAIAVAGSTSANDLYSWSQRGSAWVDIAAPGCNTATAGGNASTFCGTSSATPFAAGIAGLLRSARPDLGVTAIRAALENTTQVLNVGGASSHGVIDAGNAVASIANAPGDPAAGPPVAAEPDTTAPAVSVDGLGGVQRGWVDVTTRATDNRSVIAVALMAGTTLVGRVDVNSSNVLPTFAWNTADAGDGAVELVAVAVDSSGNTSTSGPLQVAVDNDTHMVALAGPNGARVGTFVDVTLSGSDGSGVKAMLLVANGAWVRIVFGGGPVTLRVATPKAGAVQLIGAAVDNAGRVSISNAITVVAKGDGTKASTRGVGRRVRSRR